MTAQAAPRPHPVPLTRDLADRIAARGRRTAERQRPWLDWGFGVIVPPVLFVLDRHLGLNPGEPGGLVPLRPYVSVFAFASVAVFATWLLARRGPAWVHALFAGPLLAGSVFAAGLGAVLLPFSIVGAFFYGVGLLGLCPWLTALAFGRAALVAWTESRGALADGPRRALIVLATLVFGMGILGSARLAMLVEWRATSIVAGERTGNVRLAETSLAVLWEFPQVSLAGLRQAAIDESDHPHAPRPATDAYVRITGGDPRDWSD